MKRPVFLLALLCASPAFARTLSITGVAVDQSGSSAPTVQKLSTPAGETGEIDITVTHPDGTAYNLTGANLTLAVNGQVISRQATIINATAGTAKFPLVIADTLNLLGTYTYDVTLTATDGSFYRVVPASSFVVTAGIGQPGQPVTVPASQQPLAQGPAGPTSIGHIESGESAITLGSGAGHEWLDVTFTSAFTAATGASGYNVDAQISLTTATDPTVGWSVTNKTTTGMTIQFSSSFAGEVRWKAYDVASSTAVLPNPAPSVIAGTGLIGGGGLSSNVTLAIASSVPMCTPTTMGDYCGWNGSAWVREPAPSGSGTVTSVGMSMPAAFNVSGSPVTTTGTLAASWATESANTVLGGPSGGVAATPTFRALVDADMPAHAAVCTPTTVGDYCGWSGTAWVREPAPGTGGGTQGGITSASHIPYAIGSDTLGDTELSWTAATHTFSVATTSVMDLSASTATSSLKAPGWSINNLGYFQATNSSNGVALQPLSGGSSRIRIDDSVGASVAYGSNQITVDGANITASIGGSGMFSATRLGRSNQIVAAAATLTINPASGGYVRINLSATAITSLTISAGNNGEQMVVEVVQDATGGRSIPTTWANAALAGGSYTATATANAHDVITFVYNSTLAKWVETGRAMAVS